MLPELNEDKQKEIVVKSLNETVKMLQLNNDVYADTLSGKFKIDYIFKNNHTINCLNHLIDKYQESIELNNVDISVINSSLVEYIDLLNKSQSYLIYMTEDCFDSIKEIKQKIEDVHLTQMLLNQSYIKSRQNNELGEEITPIYNVDIILNCLGYSKNFTINNYNEIEFVFNGEENNDLKESYLLKNDESLAAIDNTIHSLKNKIPLSCNEVTIINTAMVKYIKHIEAYQDESLSLLTNLNDVGKFKKRIKEIYIETLHFNFSFLLEKL